MITKEVTQRLAAKFGQSEKNTGCTEVQIALLTERILGLTPHFEKNKKDYHSMRGMLKMIGQRRSLLKYLARQDGTRYQNLIKELGLRK
jgi:small subunit ribosomal protein S15